MIALKIAIPFNDEFGKRMFVWELPVKAYIFGQPNINKNPSKSYIKMKSEIKTKSNICECLYKEEVVIMKAKYLSEEKWKAFDVRKDGSVNCPDTGVS
jgi:hypothetical protein